jgi:hypothetical protein
MKIYQLTTTQGLVRYYYVRGVADLFQSRLGGTIREIHGSDVESCIRAETSLETDYLNTVYDVE